MINLRVLLICILVNTNKNYIDKSVTIQLYVKKNQNLDNKLLGSLYQLINKFININSNL